MFILISLLVQISPVHATSLDEWQYFLYTKEELKNRGFNVMSEGKKFEATSKKAGVTVRAGSWQSEAIAKTMIIRHPDGRIHFEDLETTGDETKVLSNTHCTSSGVAKSLVCRTLTAGYCNSLLKLSTTGAVSAFFKSLVDGGDILSKVDFDSENAKRYSEGAVKRVAGFNESTGKMIESSNGAPRSLKTAIDDYAICETLSGKWAADSAKPAPSDVKATN